MAINIEIAPTQLVPVDLAVLDEAEESGIAAAPIHLADGQLMQPVDGYSLKLLTLPDGVTNDLGDKTVLVVYNAAKWENPTLSSVTDRRPNGVFNYRVYGTGLQVVAQKAQAA